MLLFSFLLLVSLLVAAPGSSLSSHNHLHSDFSSLVRNSHGREDESSLSPSLPLTSTGTTIVGLCCRDGVVLGADTRSTGGPLVVDKNKLKMHRVSPHMLCCGAGTSADCATIARRASRDLLRLRLQDELVHGPMRLFLPVAAAAKSIVRSLTAQRRRRAPSAVFVLGGVDEEGPKLYQIDSGKTPQRVAFGALGSGSLDALAVLERFYHERVCEGGRLSPSALEDGFVDIDVEQGVRVVREAVRAGILNDLGSGSHVDLCVIRSSEVRQWREPWTPRMNHEDTALSNDDSERFKVDTHEDSSENAAEDLGTLVWRKKHSLDDRIDVDVF